MTHENTEGYPSGDPSGSFTGGSDVEELPSPSEEVSSFIESNPKSIIDKLLEPVQDTRLDRIRSITFSSLNTEDPFNTSRGVFRGLQVVFSLGKGHFLKQAFGFSPEWLESVDFLDTKVKGRSLKSLSRDSAAYARLYKEYLKVYSAQPYFRKDLIGLCTVEDVNPVSLRPLVQLLLLLVISSKF